MIPPRNPASPGLPPPQGAERHATRRKESGLSLVEVMIALALLSVALIALIGKVHGCIDTARVTESQNASREYATELLAEIEAGLVDGLFDGLVGDFADRGYPQLRYVVRLGEGAAETTTATGEEEGQLYKATAVQGTPEETEEATEAEEDFTRVQITVEYPLPDGERIGTFTLEKRIATERTEGARGIEEKRKEDADAASAAAQAPPPGAGTGNESGGAGSTTGKKP